MRKDRVKVGMQIAHDKTGRHLGEVITVLDNVVRFTPVDGADYGIAGFTEITPYYGEVEDE